MLSTPSDRTKSCENLRITSQPIDCSSLVAKSLRLPSSSPFLPTPPRTPCLSNQTFPATLSDGQGTEHASLNITNADGCCASALLLPPPVWASETREPIKRVPLCGLFGLPTPSPSPGKDSPSRLSIAESRINTSTPSQFVVQDVTPPRFSISSSSTALLGCRQVSPSPDTRCPPRLTLLTHGIDGSPESPEPEVFSRSISPGSVQHGVSSSDEIRSGIKDNTPKNDNKSPVNVYRSTWSDSISSQLFTLKPPSSTFFDEPRLPSQPSPERQPLHQADEKQAVDDIPQATVPRRWPSALLQRVPLSPSRHGIRAADRFIPSRDFRTQPRENYLLATPPEHLCHAEKKHRRQSPMVDPFGRSTRITGRSEPRSVPREATLAQQNMTSSFGPTRVRIDMHLDGSHRVMSQGAV